MQILELSDHNQSIVFGNAYLFRIEERQYFHDIINGTMHATNCINRYSIAAKADSIVSMPERMTDSFDAIVDAIGSSLIVDDAKI